MADRFFQGYVYQLQGSIPRTFGVIDNKEIVSCSNQELIGNRNSFQLMSCRAAENECFFAGNNTYRIFYENSFVMCAVFEEGTDKVAREYATILSDCFTGMKSYFEEKYNRHLFYKNLFLENILPEDINVRANMMKIPLLKPRAASKPESGTPITRSASAGCCLARISPARSLAVWTDMPSMTESGRAK